MTNLGLEGEMLSDIEETKGLSVIFVAYKGSKKTEIRIQVKRNTRPQYWRALWTPRPRTLCRFTLTLEYNPWIHLFFFY